MARFFVARRADLRLFVFPLLLALFGVVMVHSASVNISMEEFGDPEHYFKKQAMMFILGLIAMIATAMIDYRFWERFSGGFLLVTIGLLILVLISPAAGDIKSWARIGPLVFQTSETAKLTFILFFSAWLARRSDRIKDFSTFGSFIVLLGIIGLLIMMQPDFGTLVVLILIAGSMYLVAGMTWPQFGVLGLTGGMIATYFVLRAPYRLARIMTFLNPAADTEGVGYHLRNINIAVGSGSWWGLGLGMSKQKRLFLPEPHNDSIFAVITEELGFLRASAVIGLMFYLIWAIFDLAQRSEDLYARYVATGIGAWLFFQSIFNVGAMIGLLPLTGVPLPFISYGGTSLVILMAAMGILVNMSKYRRI